MLYSDYRSRITRRSSRPLLHESQLPLGHRSQSAEGRPSPASYGLAPFPFIVLHLANESNSLPSPSNRYPSCAGGGPLLHSTAPSHPECRDLNPSSPPLTKEEYWNAARTALDQASKLWHEGAGERERSARAAGAGAGAAMMESRLIMDLRGESSVLMSFVCSSEEETDARLFLSRSFSAALFLARGGTSNLDSASRLYDKILLSEPTNLMALMGKARCLFSRRSFRPALRCYQQVLQMDPAFLPDPRIGVGMCLSLLGEKERGRKAWERSAVVVSWGLRSQFFLTWPS